MLWNKWDYMEKGIREKQKPDAVYSSLPVQGYWSEALGGTIVLSENRGWS